VDHPQIAAFARLAGENTPPVRALEGQKTLISRTMHGFGFDELHDEICVTSPLAQAILSFRGGADGEEAPLRVIQGPHTQIKGTARGANDKVSVDPVNNEIYIPIDTGTILVFDRMANGDVAPKRVITGPDTQLRGIPSVAIDPIHNVLAVNSGGAMLIFDRLANGNAKPKAVIRGPKSNMASISSFMINSPKGLIIAGCDGGIADSICAWSVDDSGDVPPRSKIPVRQLTGFSPSGIALDPAHKEVILSAAGQRIRPPRGIMNTVITFSWPEIF
jgi:hypothetical protein